METVAKNAKIFIDPLFYYLMQGFLWITISIGLHFQWVHNNAILSLCHVIHLIFMYCSINI